MGRSIAAVIVGYLVMAVLIFSGTAVHMILLFGKMPDATTHFQPPVSFGVLNLIYSSLFAALGGWICATIAPRNPFKHGLILSGLVFVLSLISVYVDRGQQPLWYQASIVLLGPSATAAGAWLRAGRSRLTAVTFASSE